MEKLDLEAIRRRIDKIDAQLVAALEERMAAVLEVAAYKKQQGLPVLDTAREAQVLSKACMRLQHKEYAPAVTAMMTTIMEQSKALEHILLAEPRVLPQEEVMEVGCSSKGLMLLSGGIDSPVAAYMMAKRGMKLCAIHFCSPPYTSEKAKEKVVELRNIVEKYATDVKLYIVPFSEIQMEIHRVCPAEFMITIMRRFMMRIASIVAKQADCKALITGESLGQVASQTVESMTSTEDCAELPVFRPLIAFDKEETMNLARKIGTYETSIEPFEDCCTIFLPKNPVIHPKLEKVREAEKAMDIDALVKKAVENIEIV